MSDCTREKLLELGFLAVPVAVVALCFQQAATDLVEQGAASGDAFSNSAMFPELVATVMAAVCVVIAVSILRRGTDENKAVPANSGERLRMAAGAAIIFGFVLIFRWLGFYPSTMLATFLLMLLFQPRAMLSLVAMPVLATLVVGYVFEILFKVVLPLGIFDLTLQPLFR